MKTGLSTPSLWIKLSSGLTALTLAFVGWLATPTAVAFADEGNPPTPPSGEHADALLERCLQREREWLGIQSGNLDRAYAALDRVRELIARAQEHGFDTGPLEAVLARASSAVETAAAHHATAARILDAHAGYDDDGKVIDRAQARETCQSARQALASARESLRSARDILQTARDIIQGWRENRPRPAIQTERPATES